MRSPDNWVLEKSYLTQAITSTNARAILIFSRSSKPSHQNRSDGSPLVDKCNEERGDGSRLVKRAPGLDRDGS